MEDYELGRLAEELIQHRYKNKLKENDSRIAALDAQVFQLKKELIAEKDKKVYHERVRTYIGNAGYGKTTDTYFEVDDISGELKEAKLELTEVKKFVHRNKRASSIFDKWSKRRSFK